MILRKLAEGAPEVDIITKLNFEAFPINEHTETDFIYDFNNKAFDLLGIYPDENPDDFAGYFLCIKNDKTVYISYFAILPEKRNLGIGTRALADLKEYYKGRQIVLYFESIFEECENIEQRKRRRAFYLRNGFYETGWFITVNDVNFEIVGSQENFDKESYQQILDLIHAEIPTLDSYLYRLDK